MAIDNNTIILLAIFAVAVAIAVIKLAPLLKNSAGKHLSSLAILNLTGEIYIEISKLFKDINSIDVERYRSDKDYRCKIIDLAMDKAHSILKDHGYDLEKDAPVISMLTTQAVEKLIDSITIDKQSEAIKQLEEKTTTAEQEKEQADD